MQVHKNQRLFSALASVVLALSVVAVAQPASATNNVYANQTLTKSVTSSGSYYDSRIAACVRYSISGTLTANVNRGGLDNQDVYVRGNLANPKINVSFTSNCSSWTYVSRKDVTVTTSIYAHSCQSSLDVGLSTPWSFGVGLSISCASGRKTATGIQFQSGPRSQYGFDNTGDKISFGAEHLTYTTEPSLTYCSTVGLKIQYSYNGTAYNMPIRSMRPCATWTNPYF